MSNLFIHCRARVEYRGRAHSDLESGNYCIIKKQDGTILVHGATSCKPLNFQSSGSKIEEHEDKIISVRKKETLTIFIEKIYKRYETDLLSDNSIVITRTEEDLRNKIIKNIEQLVGEPIIKTEKEYKTINGPVDVAAFAESGVLHIIEIKRGKASLAAGAQLHRYMECIEEENKKGWLMSPEASDNCLRYLLDHQLQWVSVDHD